MPSLIDLAFPLLKDVQKCDGFVEVLEKLYQEELYMEYGYYLEEGDE